MMMSANVTESPTRKVCVARYVLRDSRALFTAEIHFSSYYKTTTILSESKLIIM
ncbi:hypothetical protein Hanom_Chr00s003356g01712131 [Helianthus anomalus]